MLWRCTVVIWHHNHSIVSVDQCEPDTSRQVREGDKTSSSQWHLQKPDTFFSAYFISRDCSVVTRNKRRDAKRQKFVRRLLRTSSKLSRCARLVWTTQYPVIERQTGNGAVQYGRSGRLAINLTILNFLFSRSFPLPARVWSRNRFQGV